jgi:hypothetical protein
LTRNAWQVTPMTVMLARVLDAKSREDGAGAYGEGAAPGQILNPKS